MKMHYHKFEFLAPWGNPTVYFVETKQTCLVAIPSWNWCELLEYNSSPQQWIINMVTSLHTKISIANANLLADLLCFYVMNEL